MTTQDTSDKFHSMKNTFEKAAKKAGDLATSKLLAEMQQKLTRSKKIKTLADLPSPLQPEENNLENN